MFFDVSFERDKGLIDESCDFFIRVRLSFQPSTSASSRRRREIDQYGFIPGLRVRERRVGIFDPVDEHGSNLSFSFPLKLLWSSQLLSRECKAAPS